MSKNLFLVYKCYMYNWFKILSLDDMKYYEWGNSVWYISWFDVVIGRIFVGFIFIFCFIVWVILDVFGIG